MEEQMVTFGSPKVQHVITDNSSGGGVTSDVNIASVGGNAVTTTVPVSGTVAVTGVATATKQSDGSQKTQIVDGSGNVIGATSNALDINIKSGNPTTIAATQSGTWNINNVSGTVSLPTGASTAAKQPALGTAGSASADVITVQGITSMTPLKVDGSGTTQPVSGTVTANAGTNLNTSALALETGGNLATVASAVRAEDSASANADKGVGMLVLQQATPSDNAGTDGDYAYPQMSGGRLWVDASGKTLTVGSHAVTNAGTFAVQATEADGANTTLGAKADAKNTATDTTPVSAMSVLKQISASVQAPPSQAVTNAGTFATQSAITAASGSIASGAIASGAIASGAVASGAVASGAFAAGSIAAGAVAAGATSFVKLEDVASADADAGVPAMAIRKATPANTSGTDGDYEMLQMSAGRLWVDASGKTLTVDGSGVTQPVSGTVSITANSAVNVAQLAGTTTDTNSGNKSAGTLRVVLATDQPALTNKLLVTPDANSAVNVAQMNGVTVTMGNGTSGTGVQRVAIASDNTAIAGVGAAATGAAVPANAVYNGTIAKTSLPTAATDGNLTGLMADKFGRPVVVPITLRDLVGTQTTTITASTTETTIVTAAASIFNDLVMLICSNTSATATRVDFRDTTAGSVLFSLFLPANDTRGFCPGTPVPQTSVNTNWTAQCGTSVTDVRIYAVFAKNK